MLILELHKTYTLMTCLCGQRHTFNFNYGGVNSKPGPFSFEHEDTIVYRFDDDGPNLGNGITETITVTNADFPDLSNVTTDQMVAHLNAVLVNGQAFNDYGTVLVQSKTSGPTSCAEVLDGDAAKAMGYNVRGVAFEHFCCGRMVLGYVPPFEPRKEYPDIIMIRRCNACKGQPSIFRNMTDYSNDPDYAGNVLSRKANNTLAAYLKQNGWVDPDLVDYYAAEAADPPELFTEFPDQDVIVAKFEDVKFPSLNKKT